MACALIACSESHQVDAFSLAADDLGRELSHLDRALDDGVRILLLGENGHGVKEFTEAKVQLIEWLHREHDFDLVVFESGHFECDRAWQRLAELEAAEALRACLRYPFEHAELLPLFEQMKATRDSAGSLAVSGMDLQAQGFDSESRPTATFEQLKDVDLPLARRLARADTLLFLVPAQGGLGDSVYAFAYQHADSLRADYGRAAALATGPARLTFRLAEGWVSRLALRGAAEENGANPPSAYYALRDEWMARAIAALADSIGAPRKVVVWLHNDHARYGRFPAGPDSIQSTGAYLREWYGDAAFSVGFFLGHGSIANNARRPRTVVPIPAGGLEAYLARGATTYLGLRANGDPDVREWAATEQPYLRMGLDTLTLTPAREFDALIFVDSVSVPTYRLPPSRLR